MGYKAENLNLKILGFVYVSKQNIFSRTRKNK